MKLVVAHPPVLAKPAGRRILGAGVGLVKVPTEEEWYAMKKQMEHEMLEGSFFPPELSSVRPRLAHLWKSLSRGVSFDKCPIPNIPNEINLKTVGLSTPSNLLSYKER